RQLPWFEISVRDTARSPSDAPLYSETPVSLVCCSSGTQSLHITSHHSEKTNRVREAHGDVVQIAALGVEDGQRAILPRGTSLRHVMTGRDQISRARARRDQSFATCR